MPNTCEQKVPPRDEFCPKGGSCGLPSVSYIEFSDGSKLWLCTQHYDEWVGYIRSRAGGGSPDFKRLRRLNRFPPHPEEIASPYYEQVIQISNCEF